MEFPLLTAAMVITVAAAECAVVYGIYRLAAWAIGKIKRKQGKRP